MELSWTSIFRHNKTHDVISTFATAIFKPLPLPKELLDFN